MIAKIGELRVHLTGELNDESEKTLTQFSKVFEKLIDDTNYALTRASRSRKFAPATVWLVFKANIIKPKITGDDNDNGSK